MHDDGQLQHCGAKLAKVHAHEIAVALHPPLGGVAAGHKGGWVRWTQAAKPSFGQWQGKQSSSPDNDRSRNKGQYCCKSKKCHADNDSSLCATCKGMDWHAMPAVCYAVCWSKFEVASAQERGHLIQLEAGQPCRLPQL